MFYDTKNFGYKGLKFRNFRVCEIFLQILAIFEVLALTLFVPNMLQLLYLRSCKLTRYIVGIVVVMLAIVVAVRLEKVGVILGHVMEILPLVPAISRIRSQSVERRLESIRVVPENNEA